MLITRVTLPILMKHLPKRLNMNFNKESEYICNMWQVTVQLIFVNFLLRLSIFSHYLSVPQLSKTKASLLQIKPAIRVRTNWKCASLYYWRVFHVLPSLKILKDTYRTTNSRAKNRGFVTNLWPKKFDGLYCTLGYFKLFKVRGKFLEPEIQNGCWQICTK